MNVLSTEYQQVFVLLNDFIFLIYKYMCLMCHKSILWWGIIFISNMFFYCFNNFTIYTYRDMTEKSLELQSCCLVLSENYFYNLSLNIWLFETFFLHLKNFSGEAYLVLVDLNFPVDFKS